MTEKHKIQKENVLVNVAISNMRMWLIMLHLDCRGNYLFITDSGSISCVYHHIIGATTKLLPFFQKHLYFAHRITYI